MRSSVIPAYLLRLREATSPAHHALESLVGGDRLLRGDLDRSHYQHLLATHLAYHREVSHHMAACLEAPVLDWPDCLRIPALVVDLAALDHAPEASPAPVLSVKSSAYAMGLCYVAEGSCLGNQQLYKALKHHPDFVAWQADHFYRSCQAGLSPRWKAFLAALAAHGEGAYPELEQGALDGFGYFRRLWETLLP